MSRARLWIKDAVSNGGRQLFYEVFEIHLRKARYPLPEEGLSLAMSPVIVLCHRGPKRKDPGVGDLCQGQVNPMPRGQSRCCSEKSAKLRS